MLESRFTTVLAANDFQLLLNEATKFADSLAPDCVNKHQAVVKAIRLRPDLLAMEGKTAWEVGSILGISEQTAVRHLSNATHKLDCVNKHHAVVKALRVRLIR
jgi:hypothetical protein